MMRRKPKGQSFLKIKNQNRRLIKKRLIDEGGEEGGNLPDEVFPADRIHTIAHPTLIDPP